MKINDEQKAILEASFTIKEISEAIRNQEKKKTPGPDGIPTELYLKVEWTITPFLKEVITEIREKT